MADECCNQFGGRISIEIGDKRFAPTDADIEIMPTNREVDGVANQDGSAAYSVKPRLYEMSFTLRNPCGIVWDAEMLKCKVNVTAVEEDNNRTHLLTGARVVGRPSLNFGNGEIRGLKVMGPNYQAIAG